jgi:hypothetical protein
MGKKSNGETYFSGSIGSARVIIFKNNFKEQEKEPDYVMYFEEAKKKEGIVIEDNPFNDVA